MTVVGLEGVGSWEAVLVVEAVDAPPTGSAEPWVSPYWATGLTPSPVETELALEPSGEQPTCSSKHLVWAAH